jgi:hypothetical protein
MKRVLVVLLLFVAGLLPAQVEFRVLVDSQDAFAYTSTDLPEWIKAFGLNLDYYKVTWDPTDNTFGQVSGRPYYFPGEGVKRCPFGYYALAYHGYRGTMAGYPVTKYGYLEYYWAFMLDKSDDFDWLRSTGLDKWLEHIGCPVEQIDWYFESPLNGVDYHGPRFVPGKYDVRVYAGISMKGYTNLGVYLYDGDGEYRGAFPGKYLSAIYWNKYYSK